MQFSPIFILHLFLYLFSMYNCHLVWVLIISSFFFWRYCSHTVSSNYFLDYCKSLVPPFWEISYPVTLWTSYSSLCTPDLSLQWLSIACRVRTLCSSTVQLSRTVWPPGTRWSVPHMPGLLGTWLSAERGLYTLLMQLSLLWFHVQYPLLWDLCLLMLLWPKLCSEARCVCTCYTSDDCLHDGRLDVCPISFPVRRSHSDAACVPCVTAPFPFLTHGCSWTTAASGLPCQTVLSFTLFTAVTLALTVLTLGHLYTSNFFFGHVVWLVRS